MRGRVWASLCLALGRYGGRKFTRAEHATDMAAADADSVGVVVCSSSVAAPPRKLFGNVAKNSVNVS